RDWSSDVCSSDLLLVKTKGRYTSRTFIITVAFTICFVSRSIRYCPPTNTIHATLSMLFSASWLYFSQRCWLSFIVVGGQHYLQPGSSSCRHVSLGRA